MPKLFLTTNGVQESVLRPLVLDVLREVFKSTGIPENTPVFYPGDDLAMKQGGSAISDSTEFASLIPFYDKVAITVDEVYTQDRLLSTVVYAPENLPIFRDPKLPVTMTPVYSPQEVTINAQYRSKDKTSAMRWRDEMRVRLSMGRIERIFAAQYHYLIPEEYILILKEIHRLREAVAPYGETFAVWFAKYASQRVGEVSTLNGEMKAWAVSEIQQRILGYFDFETPDPATRDDGGDAYTTGFAFKFRFEKPLGCCLFYPLMVHNQLIKYRPNSGDLPENPDLHLNSFSLSTQNLRNFENGTKLLGISEGFAIPAFDEFLPTSVPPHTLRVFTALTNINTAQGANQHLLLNLADLGGDWLLHPAIMRLLAVEQTHLTQHLSSIFHVSLYRGSYLLPPAKVTVNSNLDVLLVDAPELREFYHVRFSIVDDPSLLLGNAKQRLREDGEALCLILQALGEVKLPVIMPGNYVSKVEFDAAMLRLNAATYLKYGAEDRSWFTAATLTVAAERR